MFSGNKLQKNKSSKYSKLSKKIRQLINKTNLKYLSGKNINKSKKEIMETNNATENSDPVAQEQQISNENQIKGPPKTKGLIPLGLNLAIIAAGDSSSSTYPR